MSTHIISSHFLKRLNFTQDQLENSIEKVAKDFNLGNLVLVRGIEEGYEDVNVDLKTTKGHFVVKILVNYLDKKPRSKKDAKYYVYIINQLQKGNIRVPHLYSTCDGAQMLDLNTQSSKKPLYAIVMEYFEGKHFLQIKPKLADMNNIALILKNLHSLTFKLPDHIYDDPWQPQFVPKHYLTHKDMFNQQDRARFESIVVDLKNVNIDNYKKTPTHGDVMRNNIMKNKNGEYCLLDFGVVTKNYWIIDFALYLSGFCLDPNNSLVKNRKILMEVTNTYVAHKKFNPDFLNDLKVLVRASYGAFYLAAMMEKIVENNDSDENLYWIDLGDRGIDMATDL